MVRIFPAKSWESVALAPSISVGAAAVDFPEDVRKFPSKSQLSAFKRCRAAFFCTGVKPSRFTPGNSVAFTAFFRNSWRAI